MPIFRYKAISADGQSLNGEIEASTRSHAIERLQSSGHLPISADEIASKGNLIQNLSRRLNRDTGVKQKEVILFTRELATLLNAGLPLDTTLRTMVNLSSSVAVKNVVQSILEKVQGGKTLSEAMADQEGVFSRLYINMIRAGEAGGSLQVVIDRVANYLERIQELRTTVITALIYPAILFVISLLSLLLLLTFVVPQFEPLFDDMGQSLPLLTEIVFSVAGMIRSYWWFILILFTASLWFADKQLADKARRLQFDAWILGVGKIGEIIQQIEIARFARTLGTLLTNGVPVLTAVNLIRDVISNTAISNIIDEVIASLEQGHRLAKPMHDSRLIPPLAAQLIEVGEESGQLEAMLFRVADIYDREVETSVKRLLTLLEPVLIIGLGGIIAVIIMSILLAMLGLNELVV